MLSIFGNKQLLQLNFAGRGDIECEKFQHTAHKLYHTVFFIIIQFGRRQSGKSFNFQNQKVKNLIEKNSRVKILFNLFFY